MIQRRRPIESAIAERKMFNMGGMAAPMQQPTYMDLMQQGIMGMPQQQMGMPQQQMGMPQQAQGIMASSQPLVDAVAADANNPAGGDTLSMAQGGVANFQQGGLGQAPQAIQIPTLTPTLTQRGGSAVFDPANPITMSPKSIMDETNSERMQRIFPDAATNAGRLTFDQEFPEFKRDAESGRPKSYFAEGAARVLQGGRAAIRDVVSEVGQDISAISNVLFDKDTRSLVGGASSQEGLDRVASEIGIARAVAEMIQRRPDAENQIMSLSKTIIDNAKTDGTELDGQKIAEAVAFGLTTGEREQAIGYDMAQRDAERGDVDAGRSMDQGEFGGTPTAIEKPVPILQDDPNLGREIVPVEGIPVAADDGSEVSRRNVEPPVPQGPFDVKGEIVPGEEPPAGTGGVLDEVDAAAYTAANQAASILDTDKKADGKTIDDFKKQFMEAMPKYEGMSEEEKGFLIAEAGLRVMAGKDPNAITNIAEGLKGLGPALMKGAKEKRAWNRQVELSAAKYALEGTAREDAKADALAKEGRVRKQFIVGKTFTDPSGVKREKGSLYTPTAAEMGMDSFQRIILPNLTTEGIYKERIDNAGVLTGIVRVGAKHGPSAEGVTKALSAYTDLTKDVRNNAKMLTMLDASIIQNAKGQVTGILPWASKKLNQLKNSVGFTKEIKILDGIDTKTGEGLERFQYQQQVIANMMLKEILGEGSKNVSNIDRTLASEIVGLVRGFSSVVADQDVLHQKLQGIRNVVQQGLKGNLTKMRNSEVGFRNTFTAFAPGSPGLSVSGQMAAQRKDLLGDIQGVGQRFQSRSEAAGRGPVVLKASDYFDFDKMTIRKSLPQ